MRPEEPSAQHRTDIDYRDDPSRTFVVDGGPYGTWAARDTAYDKPVGLHYLSFTRSQDYVYRKRKTRLKTILKLNVLEHTKLRHF